MWGYAELRLRREQAEGSVSPIRSGGRGMGEALGLGMAAGLVGSAVVLVEAGEALEQIVKMLMQGR